MKLELIKPIKALNKAYLKEKVSRNHIELFKKNLQQLLSRINEQESEEHLKNVIADFLKDTWYKDQFEINTKDRNDLVIHTGKTTKDAVGVILEVKKPSNKAEMMTGARPNTKALQELILYYLRERADHNNTDIKYLVVTNIYEWFVIDEVWFEKNVFRNNKLKKDYENWKLSGKDTKFFYDSIAGAFLDEVTEAMPVTYFDVRTYEKYVNNAEKEDDSRLIGLYKILSPAHLLKQPFLNDSNSLDTKFYAELLHIIGLEEIKDGSKKLIKRKTKPDEASLLENTIIKLEDKDTLRNISNPSAFGANREEQLFNVALELCITWINRVLFIKLLEAQLYKYHKGNTAYLFLNSKLVHDFDELSNLFFQVLAEKPESRRNHIQEKFSKVPYLNSSLFERIELERQTINVSELDNRLQLPLSNNSVLKDNKGKRKTGTLPTLQYLFEFLDAYDFTSEGGEEIQEENKNLINASVLGLIFEKINGYKDGSFFTPGFVTMYMCKETIRRAVLQKFKDTKGWHCDTIDSLYNKIDDKKEANTVINSLHICDPAVGSGHFLVSALNEMIAIKAELKILQDATGKSLRDYQVEVVNDELIITDEDGKLFDYNPQSKESQRVQETLFHEKETIIENCLFGADINPNSVKICRLRLWIELLKNAYYKWDGDFSPFEGGREGALETLPNIDINIKCGNSLISRFALDADIKRALRNSKWSIDSYKIAVQSYRDAESKEQKREMEELIDAIKKDFRSYISPNDPKYKKLSKLRGDLFNISQTKELFDDGNKKNKDTKKKIEQLSNEVIKLEAEIEEIKNNKIYENAFEWRFEFPEVLNGDGDFIGFDVVIGNPPYISLSKLKEQSDYFSTSGYTTYSKGSDIYCLFYERGGQILKSNGYLTYITSNSWLRAIYGELLKKHFMSVMYPVSLMNIEDIQVFDEATVESNIILLNKGEKEGKFPVVNLSNDYVFGASLSDYFEDHSFEFTVPNTSEWFIGSQAHSQLKLKIEKNACLLKDFNITVNRGFLTGYNEAFIIENEKYDELVAEDPKNSEIIKPILRGRDLKKYCFQFSNQWAICTFPSLNLNIEDYPVLHRYFLAVGEKRLEQSGENGSRKKTNNKWFETQDSISYWREFEKDKIVWGEISDKPKFTFDDSGKYAEATTFLMTGEKLKFLLGILNSKVSEWYFHSIGTTTGMGTNRWKKYKIELLPIKEHSSETEKEIEDVVNQILDQKKLNSDFDTSFLEKKIDVLVYDLYELTDDEINIIEQS